MSEQYSNPPDLVIEPGKQYTAIFKTERGDIRVNLFADKAPKTVNNFVFLAREGFYDNPTFHRVIPDFMVQGGDPTGTGRGGPGYKFGDETKNNPLKHERGVISMANAGPNTNGSQFFICHQDLTGRLPKNYTLFGHVTKGLDVVDAIAAGRTGAGDRPAEPVAMTGIRIEEG